MLKFLKRAVAHRGRAASRPVHAGVPLDAFLTAAPAGVDIPRYPPSDPGLPVVPAAAVMASQRELIQRLREVCGFDDEGFRQHVLAPVEAVARYIHLLPATSHEHFAGPGGLFRLCLEMALFCRQAAQSRLVEAMAPVEVRRVAEPRWRHACLLAGLLCELPRPLWSMAVTDEAGRVWPTCLGSLEAWLERVQADRYHVVWLEGSGQGQGGAEAAGVLADIVPKATLAWLNDGAPSVVPSMFRAALGQATPQGDELARVLVTTRASVLAVEAVTRRSRYGRLRIGHHLELHLVDALRHRVDSGQWVCGQGPLWFGPDGLFLEWPAAADTLRHDVIRNGVRGVPLSAFTLADVLGQAGFLDASAPGQWLWRIHPDGEGATEDAAPTALKLAEPRAVLGHAEAPRADRPLAGAGHPVLTAAKAPGVPVASLSDDEVCMVDTWRKSLDGGRTDLIAWLPGRRLALSQDLLSLSGQDVAAVASLLDRRRWLGRGEWPSPSARAGMLMFDDAVKPGLVLNDAGVVQLGLAPRSA